MSTSPRSFNLLTRAWLRGIVRDRATIFWMFAFPILFVVIFGLAFGRDDIGSYDIGVAADQSTDTGAAIVGAFRQVKPFKVETGSEADLLKKLRDGDLYAVVSLPVAQPSSGARQQTTSVLVYLDPSRGSAEQIVRPIIRQVIDGVDQQLSGRPQLLSVEERSVRSDNLTYFDFFLPGVIGFSIMQSGMFAAIPLVQLRMTRVLKRFGATPVSRWSVLGSQVVARLLLALATTAVLLGVGKALYNIHISANWPGMIAFVLLGGLVFLCLGFAVSGLAPTEESVPALVQVVSFPMMFLAGVFWPIENFPSFIQPISRALPLTFLGDGLRQTMVGGAALNPMWVDYLVLLGWALVSLVLAVRLFKWE
ncbi:MAG: ABC transporter permease [Chloroflexi bacterium]|nr:ABC transporter permease [Chloroflexota bacterium]